MSCRFWKNTRHLPCANCTLLLRNPHSSLLNTLSKSITHRFSNRKCVMFAIRSLMRYVTPREKPLFSTSFFRHNFKRFASYLWKRTKNKHFWADLVDPGQAHFWIPFFLFFHVFSSSFWKRTHQRIAPFAIACNYLSNQSPTMLIFAGEVAFFNGFCF